MSFTLYNAPQSTCSQRVRFVLNAKALPLEEKKLDLLAGDQLKPDYLALNPNGVVPTLDHDGTIVVDSSVIIEYLDDGDVIGIYEETWRGTWHKCFRGFAERQSSATERSGATRA